VEGEARKIDTNNMTVCRSEWARERTARTTLTAQMGASHPLEKKGANEKTTVWNKRNFTKEGEKKSQGALRDFI